MNYHFSIVELVKRSRSTLGHYLNNLGSTRVSMLYIPSNKAGCWSKICLVVFTIYGHGSHESLGRKQNYTDSLCRKPFFLDGNLGRKQEIADSLGGSQI